MTQADVQRAALHIDRCVDAYVKACRGRISPFLAGRFSVRETWGLQKHTLAYDLPLGLLNAAWAVPYLTARKVLEVTEKLGFPSLLRYLGLVPAGIRTAYQRKVEALVCDEILQWDVRGGAALPAPLTETLLEDPLIAGLARDRGVFRGRGAAFLSVRRLVDRFTEGRAVVSDLSGTVFTMACGWWFFGQSSLGLRDMGHRFAEEKIYREKASGFFLGKGIGGAFYELFPPEARDADVKFYLLLLGVGFVIATVIFTLLGDPLRQLLGFHRRRLETLLNDLEKELVLSLHAHLKRRLLAGAPGTGVAR